jgi:hypothetical protein
VIKAGLPPGVVTEFDLHINDVEFAEAAARALIDMLGASRQRSEAEATDLKNGATKPTGKTENTKDEDR